MGRLYYIMGKSSTGKDSIYKNLLLRDELELKRVVGYTTRPLRAGETDGVDYNFCTAEELAGYISSGKVIEKRTYPTVHGEWSYFTLDDGQIDFSGKDMLMIGTLESFICLREYYKNESIVPIYIEVEDGKRLQRALERERAQDRPRYEELCRRFLADSEDFSPDNLKSAGITNSFLNEDIEATTIQIAEHIKSCSEENW